MTFCEYTPITPNPTEACTTQTGCGNTWLDATVVLLGMRTVEGTGAAETSLCAKANCHLKQILNEIRRSEMYGAELSSICAYC